MQRLNEPVELTARPIGLAAGGGLVAVLEEQPSRKWLFGLRDSARSIAGGPIDQRNSAGAFGPSLGHPTDIVTVTEGAIAWFLDGRTHRVVGYDVGGYRVLIARLHALGEVVTACATGSHAIAYLDAKRVDTVLIQGVDTPDAAQAIPLPTDLRDDNTPWTSLRFGGSSSGPCVLWAPNMRGTVLVNESGVATIGGFVEPLYPDASSRLIRVARAVRRAILFWREPPVGAIDATSFPGGVAVLHEGQSDMAGRLIDLYTDSGEYVETMRLAARALRIAGTRDRIIVLSRLEGHTYLASYLLPVRFRSIRPRAEPAVIPPEFRTGTPQSIGDSSAKIPRVP